MLFNEYLMELIDNFAKGMGVVIDWTSNNIIPYIQDLLNRYVSYQITMCSIGVGLSFLGIIATIILLRLTYLLIERETLVFIATMIGAIVIGVLSIQGLIILVPQLFELIFIPEIYMYQQLLR